ncbi:MAG: hydrogenase nickel incorporation protein HypB [Deferribacterota bacterium]|nr:hydrogenase nickel incorporation protein HypB [Deferribacterota bacterium]
MEKILLDQKILAKNELIARELKEFYKRNRIFVLNLLSSPGSGKTSLLELILPKLRSKYNILVLVGDLQTDNDAKRIEKTGVKVVQINTGKACHLDAKNIYDVLNNFENLQDIDILFIENVGNLVCPASFDLGEDLKILLLSTPEGDDKPEKYPIMVNCANCLVINKIDLIPYVRFNIDKCIERATRINPKLDVFKCSCLRDEGLEKIINYIERKVSDKQVVPN